MIDKRHAQGYSTRSALIDLSAITVAPLLRRGRVPNVVPIDWPPQSELVQSRFSRASFEVAVVTRKVL
jgi:hypothetical protein